MEESTPQSTGRASEAQTAPALGPHEFRPADVLPGQIRLVQVDGEDVAVYNVDGTFYATQNRCAHIGYPLDDGMLSGTSVTCSMHGWCFNVTNGEVVRGMRGIKLKTYRVTVEDDIAHVSE
jgi:nitrite reductase/ring-hydroxylating ferredoxin subunit